MSESAKRFRKKKKHNDFYSCERKSRYKTDHEASKAANVVFEKHGARLHVYQCSNCNQFHLTKKGRWY